MRAIPGFGRLWIGGGLSSASDSMAEVVVPLIAILLLDATAFQVALLLAIEQLPWLLIGLPAGAWIDRWSKKRVLAIANATRAASVLLICALAFTHNLTLLLLAISVTALGIVNIFASVASHAILPEYLEASDLVAANSRLNATTTAGDFAGKVAFTPLIAVVGPVWLFFVDAFWAVAAAFVYLSLPTSAPNGHHGPKNAQSLWSDVRDGVRFVWSDRTFRVLILLASASNFLVAAQYGVIYPYLLDVLQVSVALVGVLIAAGGIGAVAGSAGTEWLCRRRSSGGVFRAALMLVAPAAAMTALATGPLALIIFVAGSSLFSALIAIINVLSFSARQASCPSELLGRMTSASLFLSWGVIPLGLLFGGLVGSALGPRSTLVVVAICFGVLPIAMSRSAIWKRRHLDSAESGAETDTSPSGE